MEQSFLTHRKQKQKSNWQLRPWREHKHFSSDKDELPNGGGSRRCENQRIWKKEESHFFWLGQKSSSQFVQTRMMWGKWFGFLAFQTWRFQPPKILLIFRFLSRITKSPNFHLWTGTLHGPGFFGSNVERIQETISAWHIVFYRHKNFIPYDQKKHLS